MLKNKISIVLQPNEFYFIVVSLDIWKQRVYSPFLQNHIYISCLIGLDSHFRKNMFTFSVANETPPGEEFSLLCSGLFTILHHENHKVLLVEF